MRYYSGQDICHYFRISPDELYNFVATSPDVHGVVFESGAISVHPHGFAALLREWGKRFSPFKPLRHPITKKAFSL
jgi:hypothetical protein